jgi:hypothetical protein
LEYACGHCGTIAAKTADGWARPCLPKCVVSNQARAGSCREHPKLYPVSVRRDGKVRIGYIDGAGKIVVEPEYDEGEPFSEGLAAVSKQVLAERQESYLKDLRRWLYINTRGEVVIEVEAEEAHCFSNGLARVRLKGHVFLARSGKLVPEYKLASAFDYSEGVAWIESCSGNGDLNSNWGCIDTNGELAVPPNFRLTRDNRTVGKEEHGFSNGRAVVILKYENVWHNDEITGARDFRWGYINRLGQLAIPGPFDMVSRFSDGRAVVRSRARYYIIDTEGIVQKNLYNVAQARGFSNGLAPVSILVHSRGTVKWGFVSIHGEMVIEPKYESTGRFDYGLAPVYRNSRFGYVDTNGNEVIPCSLKSNYGPFMGELAKLRAHDGQRWVTSCLNRQGDVVWRSEE